MACIFFFKSFGGLIPLPAVQHALGARPFFLQCCSFGETRLLCGVKDVSSLAPPRSGEHFF
jgi:hypothetical protein